jgi:hypothetical protein
MKNLFKQILTLKHASFLLLVLPYLSFNWASLYHSPFFSYSNLFGLVASILTIEVIFKITLNNKKYEKLFSGLIITTTFIFFYSYYVILIVQKQMQQTSGTSIRGRIIILFFILILVVLQLIFKRTGYYKALNIFLIIFSIINFGANYQTLTNSKENINNIKNAYKQIHLTEKSNKPVILLISDEYNSPDGLYKVFKDSGFYAFSTYLQNNKWIVRNTAYTLETSTIHSLSSLFNFNLSKSNSYSKSDIYEIGANKLIKAAIYDSLSLKKVNLINFGIFDIGKSKPLSLLYVYPKNFIAQFLFNSIYFHIQNNTNGFRLEGFNKSFYPMEEHNKFIINNLTDSLRKMPNNVFFAYTHLYMPHAPMQYKEFKMPLKRGLNSYTSYWKFTNHKLKKLLLELTKENKYRIILTGDHGYRGDSRINANHTFMAFYGFDKQDLNTVKSVQDLGNLINACF